MRASQTSTRSRSLRWRVLLRRHPSALLLLAQLACVLLYPFVEQTHAARILVGAFGVLILLLALRMIGHTSARLWPGLCLAAAAVLLNALYIGLGIGQLLPWQAALEAAFYFYAAGSLVSYMLADQRATTDELYAAGATLTLLVWAFSYLLVLCQAWQPGAFGGAVDVGAPRAWTDLVFLSFALFTSTGIGDVIPLSPLARAIASLEMFTGVMYLALVVSRLIGLSVAQRRD
ncbi:ion channel [Frateuria sp. GZRR35]|uniref:ion channel n=1 Tax=Frateuria sp. GZRR35 TaxID=3351536 RepID=UPI003EDC47D7